MWSVSWSVLGALQYAASSSAGVPLGAPQQAVRICHPLSRLLSLKRLFFMKAVLFSTENFTENTAFHSPVTRIFAGRAG